MHAVFAKSWGLLLPAFPILALALPGLYAGEPRNDAKPLPAEKSQLLTVAELNEKLKAGIFKLTEADVVKLLGRPAWMTRPGDADSELRMHWKYGTYIFATFKDGKLSEVTGSFSEQLPVERITLENFKRLRVGMTEPQVVEMLGQSNSTTKVDATGTRAWGRTGRIWVSINGKGLAFNPGAEELNAVSLPTGFQFPVPGPVKR
jgi:hypothetical protein